MKLHFLGIGSAFCPRLGNTSAWFSKAGHVYLLDCGGAVFSALCGAGVLEGAKAITVLVSHLHADHFGSLGTLISYAKHVLGVPVTVVHPGDSIVTALACMGIAPKEYAYAGGTAYEDEHMAAVFYPVRHTPSLHSYGISISTEEGCAYYSGDAAAFPGEVWQAFLAGAIHALYQDATYLTGLHGAHGSLEYLLQNVPKDRRKDVYPIHWGGDYREAVKQAGFGLAVEMA